MSFLISPMFLLRFGTKILKFKQDGVTDHLLNILIEFVKERKQRFQHSKRWNISAGVPQGSILGTFHFLIYISDLSDNLTSNLKLFADETSLFSVMHDINQSLIGLNRDLKNISCWAFQWKMSFKSDINK